MPTNFYMDLSERNDIDGILKEFKRLSGPIVAELKGKSRFCTPREKAKRKASKRRKFRYQNRPSALSPISLCVLKQDRDAPVRRTASFPALSAKPETVALKGGLASVSTVVPPVQPVRTRGALNIVRFTSDPSMFSLQKDDDKSLFGFVFGGEDLELGDTDIFSAARRETKEEIFWELDVEVPEITEKNLIGIIQVSGNHEVHVFTIDMDPRIPISKGEEQELAFRVTTEKIEDYIKRGMILDTHALAWKLYKEKTVLGR